MEEWEERLDMRSAELKRMSDYCGLTFLELEELPLSLYLMVRRDSWISSMLKTEESREVLKAITRLERKDADRDLKERGLLS